MRSFFLSLSVLLLMTTAALADSAVELQILQEFFSQGGIENRSARLTGAALEEFTRQPMVGVYLPENAKVTFR
jgi:ribosome biogenesis protein Nip4